MTDLGPGIPNGGIQLAWQVAPSGVVVTVVGELDMQTAPRLDATLCEAAEHATATHPLVLDLGGTTFLGSAGLRVLMTWHERCAAVGSSLVLTAVRHPVATVLRSTGMDTLFTVATTPVASVEPDR